MLLRPDEILAGAPDSPEAYLALVRGKALRDFQRHRRRSAEPTVTDAPLTVYANHGRWVGDCRCRAGIAVHPEWTIAACLECCTVYVALVLPGAWRDIEALLLERPLEAQNWRPGDDLVALQIETAAHGVTR